MIRKIYLDFIRNKLSKKDIGWILRRSLQYPLIHLSYLLFRPLCGPILSTFVITYKCNYACRMCDLPRRDRQLREQGLKELTTPRLKLLLKEIADLGVSGIGFTGGEPLLRPDIFELLKYSKDLGMITHLNTNGFFLHDENVKRLFTSSVDSINISLDGVKAQTHDAIRGFPGAFNRVLGAIERINLMKKKMNMGIRLKIVTVINEFNIDEIPELIKLSSNLKTDCIEFIPQQPFAGSGELVNAFMNAGFQEKVQHTVEYLLAMKKQGILIENSIAHLKLFPRSFRRQESPLNCYAAYNSFAVDCYGQIYPCLPWVNWARTAGDMRQMDLKQFWYSAEYTKKRYIISGCKDCYLNCQAELNLLFNPWFFMRYRD